ncbi:MAG TPA: gamma-glutamyl-phosphate reductase, partial [Steroidobacteraceae bacterium]|nr:gamma-glutamyl-phosphate reductase [Steroidobacteraceae bacterium]
MTEARTDIADLMARIGRAARAAAPALALAGTTRKNAALAAAAAAIRAQSATILAANAEDLAAARARGLSAAMLDRLALDPARVESMALGLDAIAALPDPVGAIVGQWQRPNGLEISRVRVPIGIIGVIYEARPNVTADAGALCIKSGNVVVLRG